MSESFIARIPEPSVDDRFSLLAPVAVAVVEPGCRSCHSPRKLVIRELRTQSALEEAYSAQGVPVSVRRQIAATAALHPDRVRRA
jgi:hypothetical protein